MREFHLDLMASGAGTRLRHAAYALVPDLDRLAAAA